MRHVTTLVIGAGQAGLAVSRELSERSEPHVILERGEVANSWKTERWNSLRLLTPNWQSRLPGHRYRGADPDGFMAMPEVSDFLDGYARAISAPVEPGVRVASVTADAAGYRVGTNRGDWLCRNLVLATGACNVAAVPACAAAVPEDIAQLTPLEYRTPGQIAPGGVLVVGASATGVQLADELRRAGHDVVLSAGEHIRMPRKYRGRDIQWWMDRTGIHGTRTDEVDDIDRARRVPSLQLSGSRDRQFLDLNALQDRGVEIVGRLSGIRDGRALFSGSLANCCAMSDLKMNRLLRHVDRWIDATGETAACPPEPFCPTRVPTAPRLSQALADGRIRTIVWATGYRPDFSWLHLPVFDGNGRLRHSEGRVAPGLHVLGLPFLRRRNSALIDGVGADAAHVARHIAQMTHEAA